MLLQRLQPPLRAAVQASGRSPSTQACCLAEAFAQLRVSPSSTSTSASAPGAIFKRYASHKAQGSSSQRKNGPGARLGAKKSGEQYVIPGNIIFRQRGTHWFPGENCAMGRDHTIYATAHGYVKYYKDPYLHPKRQYIGVVFERDMKLPPNRDKARERRLGMYAVKMQEAIDAVKTEAVQDLVMDRAVTEGGVEAREPSNAEREYVGKEVNGRKMVMKKGYMFREANWEIGRAADKANVKVKLFKPGDRWTAWRKRNARRAAAAEKRALSRRGGKSKKKKN